MTSAKIPIRIYAGNCQLFARCEPPMQTSGRCAGLLLALMMILLRPAPVVADTVLDDFEDLSDWTTSASDGAHVEIASDTGHTGKAMRIDFDLGAGGYVIVRKAFDITLPGNYAFKFDVRGTAAANNFEFKLVDRSGQNVWWYNQRKFDFPADWRTIIVKQQRIELAWGPVGGGSPTQVAAVEFAISAGMGGRGSVWLDDFRLEPREAVARIEWPPQVTASTFIPDHEPDRMVDPDPNTSWRSDRSAANQWVVIDFLKTRDYGGLVIDWDPDDFARAYQVQASDDGETWRTIYHATLCNGGRDYIYLPDGESRYIRLDLEHSSRDQGYGIRMLAVKPFEFSASPNQFFETVARDAPIGFYPKYFSGTQTYWTVTGVNGDGKQGLLNEEGMLEVDKSAFSIAPFLYTGGTLVTWNAVHATQELANGYLPIPSVTWDTEGFSLKVTAFAAGQPGESGLYAKYRVDNHSTQPRAIDLFLAIWPFQVVPPWQSLNMVGGVTPIRDLLFEARTVWVNQEKAVMSLTPPAGFGAATFEEGAVTDFLVQDKLPPETRISADGFGYASGALRYHLSIAPGGHADVDIVIPFHASDAIAQTVGASNARSFLNTQLKVTTRAWETLLGRVDFQLPPAAAKIARTVKSTLAYMLINRDGPAIEPGARNYARSWIRDGAMISAALLEMGCTEEVRDFIRWFARYQLRDGRIPCCVDQRGADRVPELDSNGEFIYAVAEYYRFTRDVGFVHEMWQPVVRTVDSISTLRQQRMTEAFTQPDKAAFFGLLPESISHEGYASHPVHSYWDDFFALRGLKDAASLAVVVGDDGHAASFAELRDAFRHDLHASIARTIAAHQIDYVPASVELADFDPTSTAIAVTIGGEQANLPQAALRRTFDEYYAHVQEREQAGTRGDDGYTPYELRNVGAFVRLGQRQRAVDLLDILLAGQRPAAWNHWAEVVWRDRSAPRFIGDMPHTWVGSSFIQSVRTMFAYERDADGALVLAAGLPSAWVMSETGVGVKRLPTYYGVLNYRLHRAGANALRAVLSGDLTVPPGNVVLQPPLPQPLKSVSVNGKRIQTFTADSATISEFPAEVVLEY
jgi:hypothetical protein